MIPILAITLSDNVLIAIIAVTPPTIVSLLALLKTRKVEADVKEVHLSLNSRLDKYIELTEKAAHAEGMKDGGGANPATPAPAYVTKEDLVALLNLRDKNR